MRHIGQEVPTVTSVGAQPLDTDLTAIAALTSAANKVPYATGAGTWALADLTAGARATLALAGTANRFTYFSATDTASLAPITAGAVSLLAQAGTANRIPYYSATDTAALATVTAAGLAILDDADAAAQRVTLGVVGDVSCLSYNAGNLSINSGTETTLTMDTDSFDNGGIHDTSSNTARHTVPAGQGGLWMCEANAYVVNAIAVGSTNIRVYANISSVAYLLAAPELTNTATGNFLVAPIVVHSVMAAGDYFYMTATQGTGSARNVNGWTSSPRFGIHMFTKRIA